MITFERLDAGSFYFHTSGISPWSPVDKKAILLLSFCVSFSSRINAACIAFTAKLPTSSYKHAPKSNPKSDISDNKANINKHWWIQIMSISCYKLTCMMYTCICKHFIHYQWTLKANRQSSVACANGCKWRHTPICHYASVIQISLMFSPCNINCILQPAKQIVIIIIIIVNL